MGKTHEKKHPSVKPLAVFQPLLPLSQKAAFHHSPLLVGKGKLELGAQVQTLGDLSHLGHWCPPALATRVCPPSEDPIPTHRRVEGWLGVCSF